jgi:hypothetical protein
MHEFTTQLAKETLHHAKELIKELDHANFPYDRTALVSLLGEFTHAHKNAHEGSTVGHLDIIITQLEELEHAYHDRMIDKTHEDHAEEMKNILLWFKEYAFSSNQWVLFFTRIFGSRYWLLSRIELVLFWSVLLLGCWMVLWSGEVHQLRYVLIVCTLATLALLMVKRMTTLWWRVVVLALVCSGVWAWSVIV